MTESDLDRCPRCGEPARYVPAGVSKRTGPYSEFWTCNNACLAAPGKALTWGTAKQWDFLHDMREFDDHGRVLKSPLVAPSTNVHALR